jgi:ribosomal protein L37AE/L43A
MNIYYVYEYLDSNNIPYYVGKGCHGRAWSNNGRLVKKPDDLSKIVIIESNLDEDSAFRLEKYMIEKYGRMDIGTGTLLNKTSGGQGTSGIIHSEERKEKIRGKNNGRYGKKNSKWHRERMSEGLREWNRSHWTDENRKKASDRVSGEKNPMFGKTVSDENKERLKKRWSGENNPNYGGVSDEHKMNMSIAAKNRPRKTCPHCGKNATIQNIERWHLDNCKFKN